MSDSEGSGSEKDSDEEEEEEEEEEEGDDEEGGKFPKSKLLKGGWQSKLHKWTKQKKRLEINL